MPDCFSFNHFTFIFVSSFSWAVLGYVYNWTERRYEIDPQLMNSEKKCESAANASPTESKDESSPPPSSSSVVNDVSNHRSGFPKDLSELCQTIVATCFPNDGKFSICPEAGICNFYSLKSKMGVSSCFIPFVFMSMRACAIE